MDQLEVAGWTTGGFSFYFFVLFYSLIFWTVRNIYRTANTNNAISGPKQVTNNCVRSLSKKEIVLDSLQDRHSRTDVEQLVSY